MERVGMAVVGLGRIGRIHAEIAAYRVERVRLVAVMDVVEGLARSTGERLGVKWYTDYSKILEDDEVDAVIISTPTFMHAKMASEALDSGKHVMVEKPLTVRSSESRDLVLKASSKGLKLQVGYMRRFDEYYSRAKASIESGEIGDPVSYVAIARDPEPPKGWVVEPAKSGGIFLDMLSHDIDMARWLVGDEITWVYASGGNYLVDYIRESGDLDFAEIMVRFSRGGRGFIQGARRNAFGYDLRTEVYGTRGTVYVDTRVDNTLATGTSEGIKYRGIPWFEKRFYDAYVAELESFAKAIIEDKKPPIDGVDGYRAVKVAEACWESYKKEKPITIEYEL